MPREPERIAKPKPFRNPAQLRAWFASHAAKESELWVLFYKVHTAKPTVTYLEAVDEALSVGWIDGKVRRVDDASYMQRFTPRRPESNWSSINIRKAQALIDVGRMNPAGLAAFGQRDKSASRRYSFENAPADLPREAFAQMRQNRKAWDFWEAQPPAIGRSRPGTSSARSATRRALCVWRRTSRTQREACAWLRSTVRKRRSSPGGRSLPPRPSVDCTPIRPQRTPSQCHGRLPSTRMESRSDRNGKHKNNGSVG